MPAERDAATALVIRPMTRADIGVGMRLKQAAGWNQTSNDWHRFLALEPHGCFMARVGNRAVGSVTSCVFGSVAWVGCLLVDPDYRRMGFGTRLMRFILDHLEQRGLASMRLDATMFGQPLYEKLGFESQFRVIRFAGEPRSAVIAPSGIRAFTWSHWDDLIDLDRVVSGIDRTKLLKRLLSEDRCAARVVMRKGSLHGYLIDRPGSLARQIGPVVARDATSGCQLIQDALARYARRPVFVDVPEENQSALQIVQAHGLAQAREFMRMCRGLPQQEQVSQLWAGSGPEKG